MRIGRPNDVRAWQEFGWTVARPPAATIPGMIAVVALLRAMLMVVEVDKRHEDIEAVATEVAH